MEYAYLWGTNLDDIPIGLSIIWEDGRRTSEMIERSSIARADDFSLTSRRTDGRRIYQCLPCQSMTITTHSPYKTFLHRKLFAKVITS
uniref:Uncharacterized protein n=1 Tax=Oryza glumipatula TaxID=40148 RepID=A0A0D9Z704_9ORYZ